MRTFAITTILLAALIGFAGSGRHGRAGPEPESAPRSATLVWPGTVHVERGGNGHFTVDGAVNDTPLSFVVDSGASRVALSREDAARAGLWVSDADFTGEAQTATATVRVADKMLPRLRVETIELRDVPAVVLDVPKAMPLLGQSFLARIDKVAIKGDRMTLTKL